MKFCLVLVLFCFHGYQQNEIKINSIRSGILPFKLGMARIVRSSHTFYHIFEIGKYKQTLNSLSGKHGELESQFSSIADYEEVVNSVLVESSKNLEIIETKLGDLTNIGGTRRKKREIISGILRHYQIIQHQPAKIHKIDTSILNRIANNENSLKNYKISKNGDFQQVESPLDFISSQIEAIDTSEGSDDEEKFNSFMSGMKIVILGENILLKFLENLENAVSFAKRNQLHFSVVNYQTLQGILNALDKLYPKQRMYFEDPRSYYDLAYAQVKLTSQKIIYAVTFPLIDPKEYNLYRLHSVPYKNVSIAPIAPYIATGDSINFYHSAPCGKIEDTYICFKPIEVNTEEDCIPDYIKKFKTKNCKKCDYRRHYVKETLIQEISSEYVMVSPGINGMDAIMDCSIGQNQHFNEPILFQIPLGCSVTISNYKFTNLEGVGSGEAVILAAERDLELIWIKDDPVVNLTKQDVAQLVNQKSFEVLTYFYMITGGFFISIFVTMAYLIGKVHFSLPFRKKKEIQNLTDNINYFNNRTEFHYTEPVEIINA